VNLARHHLLGKRLPKVLAHLGDEPVGALGTRLQQDERAHVLAAALEVANADGTGVLN